MLEDFILANRQEIIARARRRVGSRIFPKPSDIELQNGIPVFLDQLGDALRRAKSGSVEDHGDIVRSATRHGQDLLRMDLTVAQVVHDYGDICQAVTELAVERKAQMAPEEFQTLNLCLDDAIAGAVTEFSRQRERAISDAGTEHLGVLAHEMRNLLSTATLSFESIRTGRVAVGGSTGDVLRRSLLGLASLIDRSLAEVRIDAGVQNLQEIRVAEFIEEIEIGALLQSEARGVSLEIAPTDPSAMIRGDRQILASALSNLLQNGFKYTKANTRVTLTTRVTVETVAFDVEDECGGLPPGAPSGLFAAYQQRAQDRSGLGLGLAISMKAAKANGGELRVRDLPGKGCIFTLEVPRLPIASKRDAEQTPH